MIKAIALCLIVWALYILWITYRGNIKPTARNKHGRVYLRRTGEGVVTKIVISQVIMAVIMVWLFQTGLVNTTSIGIKSQTNALMAFAIGFITYMLFITTYRTGLKLTPLYNELSDKALAASVAIIPRSQKGKIITLFCVVFINPFLEEILFRGVLVHHFSLTHQSIGIALCVGLAATLLSHAYQGLLLQPFHILFYCFAVVLLFSPLGLWAVFGFHFAGDLIPVITLKKQLTSYRNRHRFR